MLIEAIDVIRAAAPSPQASDPASRSAYEELERRLSPTERERSGGSPDLLGKLSLNQWDAARGAP